MSGKKSSFHGPVIYPQKPLKKIFLPMINHIEFFVGQCERTNTKIFFYDGTELQSTSNNW